MLAEADRQALLDELSGEIDAFCGGVPNDGASQATMLALRGWLRSLGGKRFVPDPAFEAAQKADPDVPWGFLYEALFGLSNYLAYVPIPLDMRRWRSPPN
jgi:hypothetical protein